MTFRDNPPTKPQNSVPSRLTYQEPAIRGILETSFVDWPGKICAVFFLGGCNFRCPFCHNHPLVLSPETLPPVPLQKALSLLAPYKHWLGGICISGGEPTLSKGLPAMIAHLKAEGWAVKLDTNGSRPDVLEQLINDNLLDMVSMDVKAPLSQEKYDRCAGKPVNLNAIRQSIRILQKSGIEHELRMTVLPCLHSENDIQAWIAEFKDASPLKLQNFDPRSPLDPRLRTEKGFPPDAFERLKKLAASPAVLQ